MKVTIDTQQKTITLLSSFKHEEYQEFIENLPWEWRQFEFRVEDIRPNAVIPDTNPLWPPFNQPYYETNPHLTPPWTVTCDINTSN